MALSCNSIATLAALTVELATKGQIIARTSQDSVNYAELCTYPLPAPPTAPTSIRAQASSPAGFVDLAGRSFGPPRSLLVRSVRWMLSRNKAITRFPIQFRIAHRPVRSSENRVPPVVVRSWSRCDAKRAAVCSPHSACAFIMRPHLANKREPLHMYYSAPGYMQMNSDPTKEKASASVTMKLGGTVRYIMFTRAHRDPLPDNIRRSCAGTRRSSSGRVRYLLRTTLHVEVGWNSKYQLVLALVARCLGQMKLIAKSFVLTDSRILETLVGENSAP